LRTILANPAYVGRAVLGRSRVLPARPRLRLVRRNARASPGITQRVRGPREEWIEIVVPALVDVETFEAATAQLAENQKRKRARVRGPRWLLQGLTVLSSLSLCVLRQDIQTLTNRCLEREPSLLPMHWRRRAPVHRRDQVRQSHGARRPARSDSMGSGEGAA